MAEAILQPLAETNAAAPVCSDRISASNFLRLTALSISPRPIRPKRPERAYMDIVKNIQRTHEVSTPTGPVGPKRPGGDGHTAHLHVHQPLWPLRGRFRTAH